AKIIASTLVKLPYVLVTRKEIRRPEDLQGKTLGIARAGDLSDRLSRAVVKKIGLPPESVTIRPIGGSQGERYQAMAAGIVQGVIITPPLDVRAKNEGFNVLYRLIDLTLPFIYRPLHASYKLLRDRPRKRHDHQKKTPRYLRQQLRKQFGKERFPERDLGN